MELAWSAADGVVCRAGAGAVAEMLEFEVPGILIPFAAAADDHQSFNADFISDVVGGGIKLTEKNLSLETMQKSLEELFDDRVLMEKKKAMGAYKLKRGSNGMMALIQEVVGKR
jgi:UDP-N-acetylglucosamine--N-acetylmuramyl-(pentapeptide) pyrophosphoryl-undecaprenol N-acetylglucosamine transferase